MLFGDLETDPKPFLECHRPSPRKGSSTLRAPATPAALTETPQALWRLPSRRARFTCAQKSGKGEKTMVETIEVREAEEQTISVSHDFREIPVYALQESPTNPRRSSDEAKLQN